MKGRRCRRPDAEEEVGRQVVEPEPEAEAGGPAGRGAGAGAGGRRAEVEAGGWRAEAALLPFPSRRVPRDAIRPGKRRPMSRGGVGSPRGKRGSRAF